MTNRVRRKAGLALVLAMVLLLTGCVVTVDSGGTAAAPAAAPETASPSSAPAETAATATTPAAAETAAPTSQPAAETEKEETVPERQYANSVSVSTVDEFLDAIAPDTQILLQPGLYNLSTAKNYGQELDDGYYTWQDAYDGYELVIRDVEALAIVGSGAEDVTIAAEPRYANVLVFRNCDGLLLMKLTAGHTREPGVCGGGVLNFVDCTSSSVLDCGLYGCGTVGINALDCRDVTVRNTEIYECTFGAVWASSCYDVRIDSCCIRDCGTKFDDMNGLQLFSAFSTTGFAVVNSDIVRNDSQQLLECSYSEEVYLLGCGVTDNTITSCMFQIDGTPPVVDGCAFADNTVERWYPGEFRGYAVNSEGEELISFDLKRMQRKEAEYDGPRERKPVTVSGTLAADGVTTEYHVSTVDEFLAAIGPDTTIYLDAAFFDLSKASQYGGSSSRYYSWQAGYDGPTLVIKGVSNFRIVGQGKNKTEIVTTPRYADVLCFSGGKNISLEGFTAGHTKTGSCIGDVFGFENVNGLSIRGCGLYGCGVWGIRATGCENLEIQDTEIYSCSAGAFTMDQCEKVTMEGIDIHDMPEAETAYLYDCDDFLYEGKYLGNGRHKL